MFMCNYSDQQSCVKDVSSIFYYEIEERLPYLGSNREKDTYTWYTYTWFAVLQNLRK